MARLEAARQAGPAAQTWPGRRDRPSPASRPGVQAGPASSCRQHGVINWQLAVQNTVAAPG